jgi:UDP-N-acetylmuramoyl-tripeptide--D-alanyl-D-alanine ligase
MIQTFAGMVTLGWLASTLWFMTGLLQSFQLHEYNNARFLTWSLQKWPQVIRPISLVVLPVAIIPALSLDLPASVTGVMLGVIGVWAVTTLVSIWREKQARATVIKPLVYTRRVKRLVGGGLLILVIEAAFIFGANFGFSSAGPAASTRFLLVLAGLSLVEQLTFANVILANLLLFPVEESLRRYYVRSARARLRAVDPLVIGITGSYGKTSTKEILAHLLSTKYSTLKTPKSYNTLMGICKVIREELKPHHRYFVVELGAYKPGEIAQLCRVVKPRIGLLTAVGPQHLERFKTIENVARAKNELMESLPPDGVAIFNGDDPVCVRLSQQAQVKTLLYSIRAPEPQPDLHGRDLDLSSTGMTFNIIHDGQPPQPVKTVLLGRHNASNILAAALAALECGLSLRDIAQAIASLPPIEHRLQLIQGPHHITYIDDAYNANPLGVTMALEVLGTLEGRKFLVTPGLVELGSREDEENKKLGQQAAAVCDYVFLVGDPYRVGPILSGLRQQCFDDSKVFRVDSLHQAREKLRDMVKPGDVILFENDLSDIY